MITEIDRRDVLYKVQGFALYLLMLFMGVLSPRQSSRLGGWLLGQIAPLLKAQNKRVLRHLTIAFPEMSAREKHSIKNAMWRHLGMVLGEYPHLGNALDDHPDWQIEVTGSEHLTLAQGKPIVFMSAHVGNWEILPVVAQQCGTPIHAVYRAPNNPYAADILAQLRSVDGRLPEGFPKSRLGMKRITETLKNAGGVGMLIDQRHSGGEAIPFFNVPAETTMVAADLALKYEAATIAVRVKRLGPCHMRVDVLPPIDTRGKDARAITTELYAHFEDWITDAPEQWLWMHRRWGK